MDGGQGEAVRAPYADATLVKLPREDGVLGPKTLPLTDVLPTGHHAAVCAGVEQGSTVAVIGDGAVGLCAVIAAKRLGAERIFLLGHQPERLDLGRRFGATDLVAARGDEAVTAVIDATRGGVAHVVEAVGAAASLAQASEIARPGATIGYVGVPHHAEPFDFQAMFSKNVGLRGGVAPVRTYIPALMADILAGKIDPSPLLELTVTLDDVAKGYAAMDQRRATKVLVAVS
jgi:threonine dehydrogenase-like Zn-dependent dehydrogenase